MRTYSQKPKIDLVEVDAIHKNEPGITAAYVAGVKLQQAGWILYPPVNWENPAILAFEGSQCVGGINYYFHSANNEFTVNFAWCDENHPMIFARLLLRFRKVLKASEFSTVSFLHHADNHRMAKAVKALGLEPVSHVFKVKL